MRLLSLAGPCAGALAAVALALALLAAGCSGTKRPSGDEEPGFARDVEGLFAKFCFECHGEENQEAGLDLRTVASILSGGESGPAIVPGHPEESLLFDMVHDEHMPPEGEMLGESDLDLVRRWIAAGARK